MRFRVLGPVELAIAGESVSVAQPRHRAILAYLLLNANRVVTRDQLIDAVWGGAEPATANAQIHVAISNLRSALRRHGLAAPVETRPGGYSLVARDDDIDAEVFAAELAAARDTGRRGEHRHVIARLDRALRLWRGEALAGITAAYAHSARQHLHEQHLAAQELRNESELALGHHAAIIPALTRLVEENPLRQRPVCQLMLALYRSGRPADATRIARRTRELLANEQGLDPGPHFLRLEHLILNADPSLDLPDQPLTAAGAAPPAAPAPVPAQLPFDAPSFTGRGAELAALTGAVAGVGIVVVSGPAGSGKSALAAHWAHSMRVRYPDGQLYVDLRGFDPATQPLPPLEALARFLRSMGFDPPRVPGQVDEAAALFRSAVAGRRMMLILDNARDAAQVRPLLPGGADCAVVVTSRQPLATLDAHRLDIGGLPQEDAIAMLSRYAGDRLAAEPAAARDVLRYCDWLPLAIRVSGARLLAEPLLTLTALAEGLADERRRLDLLEVDDLAVRASFGPSYQALEQATAHAFGLLGALRVGDVSLPVVAALWDVPMPAAEQTMRTLVAARLVERSGDRYHLHDLIRLFAMEQEASGVEAALRRVAACYLGAARRGTDLLRPGQFLAGSDDLFHPRYAGLIPLRDVDAARVWFETERPNLVAFAEHVKDAPDPLCRYTLRLQAAMTMHLAAAGHLEDWRQLCDLSVRVSHRLGDRVAEALALMNLGAIASRVGRQPEAIARLTQALDLSRELNRPTTVAAVLSYMASAYCELGDPEKTAECDDEALRLRRVAGDRKSTAHTLSNAAIHCLVQRRHEQARAFLDEALEIKYTEGDLGGAAVSQVQLAAVLLSQRLYSAAEQAATAGLVLCQRYGDRHTEWQGLLLRSVARQRLGQILESREDAGACQAVCEALGLAAVADLAAQLLGEPASGSANNRGGPVPVWILSALDQSA